MAANGDVNKVNTGSLFVGMGAFHAALLCSKALV